MKVTIKTFYIFIFLLFMFLAGCSGTNGKQGPAGPTMPVIQSLSIVGLPVIPGNNVTTTVIAQSAQELALTYTWTVSPSSEWKIINGGNSQTATIQALGGYDVTGTAIIEVSDSNGKYAMGVIALSTQGDTAPVINSITASPNPVLPSGVIKAVVNTYDAEGNSLKYTWRASSGWAITGYGTTATVAAPSTYNTGGYVTVTVSDNYGYAVTGTIGVSTSDIIPSTPTNLTALSRTSSILLTWNASTGAASYNIYESAVSGGPYTAVGTTVTTAYTVTGITNSTPYYFVVTAQNNAAESGYSTQVKGSKLISAMYAVGTSPIGIAIDASGNVWVANAGSSTVTELSPAVATITTVTIGSYPIYMAIDASGNVWVTNYGSNNVIELSPIGATITTYTVGTAPIGIAIDASGNVWVANYGSNNVTALSPTGATITTVTVGSYPRGIAIDASGNVWVANSGSSNVTALSPTGATITTVTVGSYPRGIAIDASGNVWVANSGSSNVTELSPVGDTIGTYAVGTAPIGIAIDASGNVWVANSGSDSVTESIGITKGPQYFPYTGPQFPGGGNF